MRIISGSKRGTLLYGPNTKTIRPTTDRAKEALFNILNVNIINSKFLDLFGGTGAISLEAKSRGALEVTCIDNNNESAKTILKNIKKTKLDINFIQNDVLTFLENSYNKYDIIFLDPPFNIKNEEIKNIVNLIFKKNILKNKGTIIIEREYQKENKEVFSNYKNLKIRKYGKVSFIFIKNDEKNTISR